MVARRSVLRWGLAGTLGVVLPGTAAAVAASLPTRTVPVALVVGPPAGAYTRPLPVPAVLTPVTTVGGVDRYEIRQTVATQRIRPEISTEIWGYNGTFPGPTIVARRGRPVVMAHRNELTVPTVVHLHGGVVPPEADGYPADYLIPVGAQPVSDEHSKHAVAGTAMGSREYRYPNDQPASTLWYHDHRMGFTGPQVYRGLAGFYLIHDDAEDNLPLPRGTRDIPLMIADRTFAADGSLFYPAADPTSDTAVRKPGVTVQYHHSGMVGDTVTVNGVAWPFCEVDAALYRLRLLNASNARNYNLVLDPPMPGGFGLVQIGSETGLLPRPVRYDNLVMSPGERYDILIDFARYPVGTRVRLRNELDDGPSGHVMRFDVVRPAREEARIPDQLVADPTPPPRTTGTADRKFSFFIGPPGVAGPPMINLRTYSGARIDARPILGSTEIWDVTADPTHPVHIHGAHFRVVTRNGRAPSPQDAGWKDTVFIPDGGMRLAVTFAGFRGKYVFHCHNLEHGDAGMMANLEVQ